MQKNTSQGLYNPEYEHDSCGVGFVAHIKGRKSHDIVQKGLLTLNHLEHRGASGAEINSGDGAGILVQVPHEFLKKVFGSIGVTVPNPGQYGVGTLFLSQNLEDQKTARALLQDIVAQEGQKLLGWRDVPVIADGLGNAARSVMPKMEQFLIAAAQEETQNSQEAFERALFIIRKVFERGIQTLGLQNAAAFCIPSLSSRTLIYKGMLTSPQLEVFFPDLKDPIFSSALALVHSRFSTNTFPNWELAHPFRFVAHNGEINTLRGNINWMRAREGLFSSKFFGSQGSPQLQRLLPIIRESGSDSAIFDNVFEMLVLSGRSLPHAIMMMIPEAWSGHETMSSQKKAFYEYHSCLMEPWDGPACMAFTDGRQIGAVLDRNGLRPARYTITKDDLVVMASETGVLDFKPEEVVAKGRLQPGKMFLVDLEKGCIVDDAQIKAELAKAAPYAEWLQKYHVALSDLPASEHLPEPDHATVTQRQAIFGYTHEAIDLLMAPMARQGEEATGSMGTDTPLAVLSKRPQSLFNYFQQLFAQVTNPPLDAIREEIVTSVDTTIGAERNLLEPGPESCHQIKLKNPILDNDELAKLKKLSVSPHRGFASCVISTLFPVHDFLNLDSTAREQLFVKSLESIFAQADRAIEQGCHLIILSDRGVNQDFAPIPSLLATAGLHHHLVRRGTRSRVGLIVESGEPHEVHHFALLLGYGAGAINPYLAFETLDDLIHEGILEGMDHPKAVSNYIRAVKKGIIKVMSKMGISTIQSYRGAQIFEAIGLNKKLVDRYFTHTASRIEGIGLATLIEESLKRHLRAFPKRVSEGPQLEEGGNYHFRVQGEYHLFNPDTISKLQYATQIKSYDDYLDYARLVNEQSQHQCTLRGLFSFKHTHPIPLEEVEPAQEIVRRFKTGAMSYGSISKEAHETLAVAMNRMGAKSNTGEGGEDPIRYRREANGDSKNSAIKQVASGRFGVTSHYLVNAQEIQIKIAQGAKPGEGGQLPGHKVYPPIAKVRHSTPGVGLISPPPHHDIYSIEDLAQLIYDLKNSNPQARISVKLVAEVGVGTVAAGVAKAHADLVLISGHDGGTGASPQTSIKHAGGPWELGLAETQQVLVRNHLRDRIVVEADGQMKTGRDVAIAALLGAEEYGFSTAPLVVMGCVMMRVCHLNTCPVGIATQDPQLRQKFAGTPEAVINFFFFVAEELRAIMAQLGFRKVEDMIGRSDLLDFNKAIAHYKSKGLDFSSIFYREDLDPQTPVRKMKDQDHGLALALDYQLLPLLSNTLEKKTPVRLESPIQNSNRTVGTIIGSEVTRRFGPEGLPEDTLHLRFSGSAGQSFGAFIPAGMTLELEGDANDYVGKGLSGGKLILYPSKQVTFVPEQNILLGNVVLYGATAGEAYFRGMAGERFCVRNSGATAVVEGVGDHGCEYMTGGRVLILGPTGRNFAAGMSGGVAYVLDKGNRFRGQCNLDMVDLEQIVEDEDIASIRLLLTKHLHYTGSGVAKQLLDDFETSVSHFVKVMPRDYKRVLTQVKHKMKETGVPFEVALYGA